MHFSVILTTDHAVLNKFVSFGNLNNLQFLCENGRVHKFANSFCSLAFMFQELTQGIRDMSVQDNSTTEDNNRIKCHTTGPSIPSSAGAYSQLWTDYVARLSKLLCSFILAPEDIRSQHSQVTAGRISMAFSSVYGGLSIKWFLRVLRTIFPCIKTCSNQNELPSYTM